jgi:hypothetical protein
MKKLFTLILVVLAFVAASAQKTVYDPNAEVRTVGSFHAVQLSHAFSVIITQGSEEAVAVSAADKDLMAHIKTKVENGVLKIGFENDKKWNARNPKLKAYISVKNLDAIRASGACEVKIEGTLNAPSLKIELSGASDLTGKINVSDKLDAHLSGASDLSLTGIADNATIDVNGASEMKAYDFTTSNCKIEASGASSVQITVDKELSANVSGASNVRYKGTGMIRDIKTSGAGSISRKS